MTRYHTFIDASTEIGQTTIDGILQNGSEFGVGISSEITIDNLNVDGGLVVSGVSTVGLSSISNPIDNSTFSFELLNNNTLSVRVRGSDGKLRTANILLEDLITFDEENITIDTDINTFDKN
jgi:hypothetical protein